MKESGWEVTLINQLTERMCLVAEARVEILKKKYLTLIKKEKRMREEVGAASDILSESYMSLQKEKLELKEEIKKKYENKSEKNIKEFVEGMEMTIDKISVYLTKINFN